MGRTKSGTSNSRYLCAVPGCTSDAWKTNNIDKYPWMKDVDFVPFPTQRKNSRLRNLWIEIIRRPKDYIPLPYHRVCTRHFVGNKASEHDVP